MLDVIGQILWFGSLFTPLITIPFFWREKTLHKIARILLGLLVAFCLSALMVLVGFAILVRDGLGPG